MPAVTASVRRLAAIVLLAAALLAATGGARAEASHDSWPFAACGWSWQAYVPTHAVPRVWQGGWRTGCGILKRPVRVAAWNQSSFEIAWRVGYQWCVSLNIKPRPPAGALMSWAQAAYRCRGNVAWSYVHVTS